MKSDRPAPTQLAALVAVLVVALAPLALGFLLIHAAFNSAPTTGGAFVELEAAPVVESESPDGQVQTTTTVVAEVYDQRIVDSYYLVGVLGHGMIALVIVLLAVVAVCVLLRRPFSRVVSLFLLMVAVYASVAYFVGPNAREWAQRRVAERHDPGADLGLEILPVAGDWYAWHGLCGTVAVLSVAAALYVEHARQLQARSVS